MWLSWSFALELCARTEAKLLVTLVHWWTGAVCLGHPGPLVDWCRVPELSLNSGHPGPLVDWAHVPELSLDSGHPGPLVDWTHVPELSLNSGHPGPLVECSVGWLGEGKVEILLSTCGTVSCGIHYHHHQSTTSSS